MIKYVFKEDEPLKIKAAKEADPQAIGEAMAKIKDQKGGNFSPDDVWQAAKDAKHPLHKHYEWDVGKAAEAHWRSTSRHLIRVVQIIDDRTHSGTARAFVSIADKSGTAYRSMEDVSKSVDLQLALLKRAEADLESFEVRYRDLTEICEFAKAAKVAVAKRRTRLEEGGRRRSAA